MLRRWKPGACTACAYAKTPHPGSWLVVGSLGASYKVPRSVARGFAYPAGRDADGDGRVPRVSGGRVTVEATHGSRGSGRGEDAVEDLLDGFGDVRAVAEHPSPS
jgi:hypothetical protein